MRTLFLFLIALITFASCEKEIDTVIVEDNIAPPDSTIPYLIKENYVNRAYISLLGRKPDPAEESSGLAILNKNDLSSANRDELLEVIMTKSEYYGRLYEIANNDYLNGLDTSQISVMIITFQTLLLDSSPPILPFHDLYTAELTRLLLHQSAYEDLNSGLTDVVGLHQRLTNNYFYDQINMGSENFVVSMFQNFLFRYPTTAELTQGKQIVDGLGGTVFLEYGNSKDNFLTIFFSSSDYIEGQVRSLYLRYLFREPTTDERSSAVTNYNTSEDYKALQKQILSSDEYIGL